MTKQKEKKHSLDQIAQQAILATREGRLEWHEALKPRTFRATLGPSANPIDIEISPQHQSGIITMTILNSGELTAAFQPSAQEDLRAIIISIKEAQARQADRSVQDTLDALQTLRETPPQTNNTQQAQPDPQAGTSWSLSRTILGRDEAETQDIELEVDILFTDPQGQVMENDFWQEALDYFLEYDELKTFIDDTDYWHQRADHLLTGTSFHFDLHALDFQSSPLSLAGEAVRYLATETYRGDYHTLTDDNAIISRINFEMRFRDTNKAGPVLAYIARDQTNREAAPFEKDEHGEPIPFTGPIDPTSLVLERYHHTVRANRMSFTEVVAYLSGQEHNDYPRGVDDLLNEFVADVHDMLEDEPRQAMLPLAKKMVHSYCQQCTLPRMEELTTTVAQEYLPVIFRQEGWQKTARVLERTPRELGALEEILNQALSSMPDQEDNPAVSCAHRSLANISTIQAMAAGDQGDLSTYSPETDNARSNASIATFAKAAGMDPHQLAEKMVSIVTQVIQACPHRCECGGTYCQ